MPLETLVRPAGPDLAAAADAPAANTLSRYQSDGVAIDFTTPILANARVRPAETDRLEVIVADLGGGKGSYVVPLRHLGRIVTLTVHDRTLCEEILHRQANAPDEIRRAVLAVARMGLAGAKAAKTARQAIADEQNERLLTTVFLIHRAINHASRDATAAGPSLTALAAETNRGQVKAQLGQIAQSLKLTGDQVYAELEDWGAIVGGVGVPGMPLDCRLRRLARQVDDMAGQLRRWADEEISYAGDHARRVADAAQQVAVRADKQIAKIDAFAVAVVETLRRWKDNQRTVRAAVGDLAWILNGWEANLRRWRDAAQVSREEQQKTVSEIMAAMPPRLAAGTLESWSGEAFALSRRGSRKVRAHQDWKTGAIDFDVVRRLESLKEHVL